MPTPDSATLTQLFYALVYFSQASILVPIVAGFRRRQQLASAPRVIFYCCLMWLVMMSFGTFAGKFWGYNVAVWDAVDILEMWFIGVAYHRVLRFRLRRYFLPLGILYTAFALLDAFVLHGLMLPITYTTVLKSAFVVVLTLLYFEQILRELRNVRLERDPMFVISVALLLYYAGTVVALIMRSYFFEQNDVLQGDIVYAINSVLNLVMHGLIARGFWLTGRQPQLAVEPLTEATAQQPA
ncbi:hypothetical protein [Hymenobacter sp. APR13]|uniref:hypothetical protein n=1 Tax=Hymenobacter sp. APR13 TaxID=1356852 RepID=UPI0004E0585E|nr:hypothetical protein [Hymenobacter sp. APR13]AII51021.1 hypothetical protein N008_03360 [Hymenobacter sp. APR13]